LPAIQAAADALLLLLLLLLHLSVRRADLGPAQKQIWLACKSIGRPS
jgi:hypothetical protein